MLEGRNDKSLVPSSNACTNSNFGKKKEVYPAKFTFNQWVDFYLGKDLFPILEYYFFYVFKTISNAFKISTNQTNICTSSLFFSFSLFRFLFLFQPFSRQKRIFKNSRREKNIFSFLSFLFSLLLILFEFISSMGILFYFILFFALTLLSHLNISFKLLMMKMANIKAIIKQTNKQTIIGFTNQIENILWLK